MKKGLSFITIVSIVICLVFSSAVMAGEDRRPSGGAQLTDDQKAQVAAILSQYDASSLAAEDARAINNAFREAGIRRGEDQKEAIQAAGFDPETIRSLNPPPERPGTEEMPRRGHSD